MAWGETVQQRLSSRCCLFFLLQRYLVFLREQLNFDCPTKPLEEMSTFIALGGRSEGVGAGSN